MIRFILVLTILLFNFSLADETIQGGIKYNEATAKVEAFKDIERKINRNTFKDFLKDKNKKENLAAIEQKKLIFEQDRQLCPFYLKNTLISYAVTYFNDTDTNYYYDVFGNLIKFEITKEKNYPKKTVGYTKLGNLISVAFEADENEHFIYDKNGKLIAHWLDNKTVENIPNNKLYSLFKLERGLKDTQVK